MYINRTHLYIHASFFNIYYKYRYIIIHHLSSRNLSPFGQDLIPFPWRFPFTNSPTYFEPERKDFFFSLENMMSFGARVSPYLQVPFFRNMELSTNTHHKRMGSSTCAMHWSEMFCALTCTSAGQNAIRLF
jgi:hypothetical protein